MNHESLNFDDALGALLGALVTEWSTLDIAAGVVVRDVFGRLAFFAAQPLAVSDKKRVSKKLHIVLGRYARRDRVLADPSDVGAEEILASADAVKMVVDGIDLRLIDRRLVGADWMRLPQVNSWQTPCIVFGSIKGGVGRSTALAVAAADQASRGRRVLALDLDMEAPGIGSMLLDEDTRPQFGTIDILLESALGDLPNQFYVDAVGPSPLTDIGKVDVVPAFGLRSLRHPFNVLSKISRAYSESLDASGAPQSLLDRVRDLVGRFAQSSDYDVVFIDARAGLHESTAASLIGLGAEVLLFGIDEPQTFEGYAALLGHMAIFSHDSVREWADRVTMIQAKSSPSESEQFQQRCEDLFARAGLRNTAVDLEPLIPLPADPFDDVPWDDRDQSIDQLLIGSAPEIRMARIYDDGSFRAFDPVARRELLKGSFYSKAFGEFLEVVDQLVTRGN